MTTSVIVKANHGFPVLVTYLDPQTGRDMSLYDEGTVRVEPGTERTFYAHYATDLLIHEIQPREAKDA